MIRAALLLLLLPSGFGHPMEHGEEEAGKSASVDEAGTEESTLDAQIDWEERRRQAERRRMDSGQARVTVFEGRLLSCGLPDEPTEAETLSKVDAQFILEVEVSSLMEGALPDGWTSPLRFAIHSPALFFGRQGLTLPEGSDVPQGQFVFEVWTDSEGWFDLAVFSSGEG